MSEKRRNVLILAVVVLLAAASAGVVIARGFTLGLDLRGGLEVVLKAQPKKGQTVTSAILGDAANVMRNRIDPHGTLQPDIRTSQSDGTIEIQVPGVKNPKAVSSLLTAGQLLSFNLYRWLNPISGSSSQYTIHPYDSAYALLKAAQPQAKADIAAHKLPAEWGLFDTATKSFYKHSQLLPTKSQVLQLVGLPGNGRKPRGTEWLAVPANTIPISCDQAVVGSCPINTAASKGTFWYLFNQPSPDNVLSSLRGDITGASSTTDQTGAPIVSLSYSDHGAQVSTNISRDLVNAWNLLTPQNQQAFSSGLPQIIAVNNQVVATPVNPPNQVVDATLTNSSEINNISKSQADRVALEVQSGTLPVTFTTESESIVSATLGKSSLHDALVAGIAGLVFVLIFLLLFYGFLGLIADLALIVYGLLLAGIVVLLPVTMTLPGIAGTILTIGVAADANIVIFERIKEEVRAGKSIRAAISTGYRRGWHTIIDANVVTLITAAILYVSTTASVKGFALMLLIGVITSIFTAVVATRAMLGVLSGFAFMRSPRVLGQVGTGDRWKRFDFIGRKRWWFAFSGTIIVLGLVSLGVRGLNEGIDFTGGSKLNYDTAARVSQGQMQNTVTGILGGTPEVQGLLKPGEPQTSLYDSWQVQAHYMDAHAQKQLITTLEAAPYHATQISLTNVSSSFGRSVLDQAILAIIFSLIIISGYIWYRFEWRFAVPVLIALFHDILITIGVYSLTGRQVTSDTVAAVLTVLGYSLYDTVIVFDRVRENIPILRRSTASDLVNESLAETITRSLNTSLVTLIPVILMFIFGSGTLTDFAFALIVGIASGAYSSIFIAAPLLAILLERDPGFAKRRADQDRTPRTPTAPAPEPAIVAGGAAALPSPLGAPRPDRPSRRRRRGHGRAR